jgi:glutamate formiminotransferase/formiminotetrahydrofolate cyclodeaminase
VIGARAPLIAYNIYLTTGDVAIAKKIAAAIRTSSGGLPYVKARGMLVEGRAQVSINMTDFTRTPVATIVEAVRREARALGVDIHHAEVVGLIPQAALLAAACSYLQLDAFQPEQVLESRLFAAQGSSSAARGVFLEELAEGTPAPGGGSAAAYAAAMGAALVGMVARLTIGKKKYAGVEDRMRALAAQADEQRASLAAAVERDAQAFEGVLAAARMPKASEAETALRQIALDQATIQAATIPLEVARRALQVIELAAEAAETGNVNAISDALSAAALAHAGLRAAAANVRINAAAMREAAAPAPWLVVLDKLEAGARDAEQRAVAALSARLTPPG